ncbi:MAG: hypothetical protein Q8K79_15560 [Solirubrobacteraceae bacterium]|nr:hypothetical protein [Solirubrobacteraceae bacterium]
MQDEQAEQTDEATEPTAEETEGAAEATAEDTGADAEAASDDAAAAVDAQASPGGAGETVLKQPEVPDDANDTIAAAQEHINSLNMDREREAAERAQKQL